MLYSEPARTTIYRSRTRIRVRRILAAGLLVVIAATAAALVRVLPASISTTDVTPTDVPRAEHHGLRAEHIGAPALPAEQGGVLGEADGALPDGATVFDDQLPGVANLDADLLTAQRQAASDAADNGVEFIVDSGWRSAAYQERLLEEAVAKYGSEEEAARWVATPETSSHVSGDAVDIGPSSAAEWLSEHGAAYGLCQIYANEPWHYELRPEATNQGCPAMYADPTHDPRMEQ